MREIKNILLGYRNPLIRVFKYPRSKFKVVGAVGLMSLSFIIPDLGTGFIMGLMLLNPVSLKSQLKIRIEDIKFKMFKLKVRWGLI